MRGSLKTLQLADQILSGLPGAVPQLVRGLLERGDHKGLIALTVNPALHDDWDEFFSAYQAVSLLSKYPYLDLGVDRAAVAMSSFWQSEELCRATNISLQRFNSTVFTFDSLLPSVVTMARGKIERLLSSFNWDEALHFMHFTGGASTDVPRRKGDSYYKYGAKAPSTTGTNAVLAELIIKQFPQWATIALDYEVSSCGLNIVHGNRLTTVPKSAKTDRVIAIEPTMNMFVQKAIGTMIRRRLRSVGIDLNDQSRNQALAWRGSLDGSLATIDLRSASDTVSCGIVDLLLPEGWVTPMKIARSPCTLIDGSLHYYQKFSSMGNGFTFELESMIFWAISESVTELCGGVARDVSVYGDDIIVPSVAARRLIEVLSYFGFQTNTEKTFIDGPFRESCGKHYFRGRDVTPFYLREKVETLERKLWAANSIAALAHRRMGFGYGRDGRLFPAYQFVVSGLPEKYQRPKLPLNCGDGGLTGDFDEVCPPRAPYGHEGWLVRHRVPIRDLKQIGGPAALVKVLREGCDGSYRTMVDLDRFFHAKLLRKQVGLALLGGVDLCKIPMQKVTYRVVNSVVRQWEGHGPWVGLLKG